MSVAAGSNVRESLRQCSNATMFKVRESCGIPVFRSCCDETKRVGSVHVTPCLQRPGGPRLVPSLGLPKHLGIASFARERLNSNKGCENI